MYNTILSVHSYLAYAALGLLFIATINAIFGLTSKGLFKSKDRSISLFALIVCHMQLLAGLILYFVSEKFEQWSLLGMKIMKNDELRQLLVEHPLTNIIALVLITIGWSKHKKEESNNGKFKKIAIFYTLGLLLLLLMVPYNQWLS
ncbi:MAG: hypothetical protein ACH34V_03400 [Flavobacterium sp.]|uniref:hypothetical protein n=1 Tax=Flavobacterium sp. TaxID=239 RepID=UPI00259AD4A3|nr:hypothetical protein [uncultured Flavobacterium sp.]